MPSLHCVSHDTLHHVRLGKATTEKETMKGGVEMALILQGLYPPSFTPLHVCLNRRCYNYFVLLYNAHNHTRQTREEG